MKVLLVEDDALLQTGIQAALKREGWLCEVAATVKEAKTWLDAGEYALVLLDLGLPDGSGLQVLSHQRQAQNHVPTIILTARDEVQDRVSGLDAGADDYLIKPFALVELLARMRSVLRRSEGHSHNLLQSGQLSLDLEQRIAYWQGQDMKLTGREYAVLNRLLLRIDQVVVREVLLSDVYTWADHFSSNTLEVYVYHVRQKLPTGAIETIRGQGYRLCSHLLQNT